MAWGEWLTTTDSGRWLASVGIAGAICALCYARHSLTALGTLAAFPVGLAAVAGGARFTAVLLTFFVASTVATRVAGGKKQRFDSEHAAQAHKGRRPSQVLASGGVGALLALVHAITQGAWNDSASTAHGLSPRAPLRSTQTAKSTTTGFLASS